ncbi:MAG: hypothetical protein Q9185_003835 [Variospora sp. 1 TL-2023]
MFSGGILVMVAGILRCVLILTAGVNGPQQAGVWSIRESFIAVVVGNLPMLYTLLQRIQQSPPASFKKSSGRRSDPSGSYRTGGSSKAGRKVKKFRHPLSMPNDTAMDSDEQFVLESKVEHTQPPSTDSVGKFDFNQGGDRSHDGGIRVQTDLHIESSESTGQAMDRGNDYHQFSHTRV